LLGVRLRNMRASRTLKRILVTSTIPRKARAWYLQTWLWCWLAGSNKNGVGRRRSSSSNARESFRVGKTSGAR
jgi:hypothetical protein